MTVCEDETKLDHVSKFVFKRGARSTVRRFGKGAKIIFRVLETAKLRIFFGDKEIAKGEMKLNDLLRRCDVHAKVPLAKSKSSRAKTLLELEVKAELRQPIEGQDLRPFSIEYQVLRDDFSFSASHASSPPPPTTAAPKAPTKTGREADRKDVEKQERMERGAPQQHRRDSRSDPLPEARADSNQRGESGSNLESGEASALKGLRDSRSDPPPEGRAAHRVPEAEVTQKPQAEKLDRKATKPTPQKKIRPLPPGVTFEEVENPNDILKYRSFDALEDEINLIQRKLKRTGAGPARARLESRKKQAENIRDLMILNVQEGKMSMENYLDLLRMTIDHDEALAKEVEVRRKEEGSADLFILQKRIVKMKTELKNAEENQGDL